MTELPPEAAPNLDVGRPHEVGLGDLVVHVLPVQLDDEAQVAVDAERRRFADVSIEHLRAVREEEPVLGDPPS